MLARAQQQRQQLQLRSLPHGFGGARPLCDTQVLRLGFGLLDRKQCTGDLQSGECVLGGAVEARERCLRQPVLLLEREEQVEGEVHDVPAHAKKEQNVPPGPT